MASKRRFFIHLKSDDKVEYVPETNEIAELQNLVGGYVQRVFEQETGYALLVDEDAKCKVQLPPMNRIASWFYEETTLFGDVVVCKEEGGEFRGWTREECDEICRTYCFM